MKPLAVFTTQQTERLTRLSRRTIMRWQAQGVFIPDYPEKLSLDGPYRRIFSFRDVVGLRTLAKLRQDHDVEFSELERVSRYLRNHRETPWLEQRFWVVDRHVVFRDPSSDMLVSGRDLSQIAIEPIVLGDIADAVEQEATEFRARSSESLGKVTRNRNVMSNRPVLAGTRITTSAIWEFHIAGYATEQIIEEFPDLSANDVEAAIAYEADARKAAA